MLDGLGHVLGPAFQAQILYQEADLAAEFLPELSSFRASVPAPCRPMHTGHRWRRPPSEVPWCRGRDWSASPYAADAASATIPRTRGLVRSQDRMDPERSRVEAAADVRLVLSEDLLRESLGGVERFVRRRAAPH